MSRGVQEPDATTDLAVAAEEASKLFARAIGVSHVPYNCQRSGTETFLNLIVGQSAPIYNHALRTVQLKLDDNHPFMGLMLLDYNRDTHFPNSLEANVLLSMLTRSTRHHAVQDREEETFGVSYVPFQNNEEDKIIQPASHVIAGRRGVGKSMLITRGTQLLKDSPHLCVTLDMQAYSESSSDSIFFEVIGDISLRLAEVASKHAERMNKKVEVKDLEDFANSLLNEKIETARIAPCLRRIVDKLTKSLEGDVFVFLDDFHVIDADIQPRLLHVIHGALKGARGWIKVTGLHSRLKFYDAATQKGLQIPGDAQLISLDLTLVDPSRAETHLVAIIKTFLELVGVESPQSIIPEKVMRRLVWATAGVPRDFLEMIGKSLEHAGRLGRAKITLTDANLAIGEFGQRKLDDMKLDARNVQDRLRETVRLLETFCLEQHKVNAFLVRSDDSPERQTIQVLSDLRIVHLLNKTITPHKAGERFEAFLLDYCTFTGFRRRPGIKEMFPEDGKHFKAKELRRIKPLPAKFLQEIELDEQA